VLTVCVCVTVYSCVYYCHVIHVNKNVPIACCGVGIPTLVLVDVDDKIISKNARFVVASDVEGKVSLTLLVLKPDCC